MFSRHRVHAALLVGASAILSACTTTPYERAGGISPDPGFGETTKYNAAVQVIDPDPVYAATDSQPGESGIRGSEAVKRYRTGTVKQVEAISVGGGGGSQ